MDRRQPWTSELPDQVDNSGLVTSTPYQRTERLLAAQSGQIIPPQQIARMGHALMLTVVFGRICLRP